jgi:hypothetical protein
MDVTSNLPERQISRGINGPPRCIPCLVCKSISSILAYMVPTFNSSCPQCDATFTRVMYNFLRLTIYLRFVRPMPCADTRSQGKRRHSTFQVRLTIFLIYRHNGVVLDLLEQSPEHDENTQSRTDALPSSKSNEEIESCTTSTTLGTPTYSGPSNYYRLHTATISRTLQCSTYEFICFTLEQLIFPHNFSNYH